MKRRLISIITATLVSCSMVQATETDASACGLVIKEALSSTEGERTIERRYPVIVNLGENIASSGSSTSPFACGGMNEDVLTVQMYNGTTKLFKKKAANDDRGYWYGEDETDGSTLNYMYNTGTGAMMTGSLNDMTSGDLVQFRRNVIGGGAGSNGEDATEEYHLFAFVRNQNNFGAD